MKTNKWEVEGGVYSIMIGASCADIRLQDSLAIIGTTEVMPYYTNRISSYVEGKSSRSEMRSTRRSWDIPFRTEVGAASLA